MSDYDDDEGLMPPRPPSRAARWGSVVACTVLVVVIVGLLVATWMPAIVSARMKREGTSATQPATVPATQPTDVPERAG